jgi:hypothetical protein
MTKMVNKSEMRVRGLILGMKVFHADDTSHYPRQERNSQVSIQKGKFFYDAISFVHEDLPH